jgi:rhodanese-related sulfurtransferase
MKMNRPLVQTVVLVLAAFVIAVVANGFAGRTRRLVLPGFYPMALKVPARQPDPVPETASATTTLPGTATVQSPGPGQPPMVVATDTIQRPAGTTTATATKTAATSTLPATTTVTPIVPSPTGDPRQTAGAAPAAPPQAAAEPSLTDRFPPHPDKPYVEISGDDVAWLHGKGALFLDARRTSVFEQGHIAGARSFSVWEADIDDKVNNLYNERNDPREQNLPIVIYCSGGACEDSHMLAQKLWGLAFNNVYVYKDGFPDWQKRNGAVRTGGQP